MLNVGTDKHRPELQRISSLDGFPGGSFGEETEGYRTHRLDVGGPKSFSIMA